MDTIFAVSSGVGRSAIAVIRISGPDCAAVQSALVGRALRPREATLAELRDPSSGQMLDQSICIAFPKPASFTGEDCLELHVHGGRAVVQSVLAALGNLPGLRAAQPGEFTRRAFDNGKMTLESAEGLADLIQADTFLQQQQALSSLTNGLPRMIEGWRQRLISSQAMLDAWLDFPDESEISDALIEECRSGLVVLLIEIENAIANANRSEVLRNGVKVLIAGPPNAGKSSLLNRLAQRDAAIVSDIPGTTRDILEVALDLNGVPVAFLDGAGVRDTEDTIEALGIDRVKSAAKKVNIILWICPADDEPVNPPDWLLESDAEKLSMVSKVDLAASPTRGFSTVTGIGVEDLMAAIGQISRRLVGANEDISQLRHRHIGAIANVTHGLKLAISSISNGRIEVAAEDCRQVLISLGRVSAPVETETVLGEVFARFCIGK